MQKDVAKVPMKVRQAPRIPVRFQSHQSADDFPAMNGTVLDLSLFGCRISTNTPVSPGTAFTLRIDVPGCEEPIQIARADVQWVRGQEFGLSFLAITANAYERLAELLQQIPL
jgi:PilZ domain